MTEEELRRLSGWAPPFRPLPSESLDEAWRRCPDARWMLAVAIEAGVRPRTVTRTIVTCLQTLVPELWDEPPWRGALYVAAAYGRGEMDAEALRQLVPAPRGSGVTGDWVAPVERVFSERAEASAGALAVSATYFMLGALHPDTEPRERAKTAARLVDTLASVAGLRARAAARDAGAEMLDQHRKTGGTGVPVMLLPAVSSGAWDEAAERAHAHALLSCAGAVREVIAGLSGT